MPFSFLSSRLFSALIASSPLVVGGGAALPLPRPPRPAEPVVTPGSRLDGDPEDCAVPALLVPRAGGAPLMPDVPVPIEPEFGEPPADDPPPPCANETTGHISIAIAVAVMVTEALFIGISPLRSNNSAWPSFPEPLRSRNDFRPGSLH